VDKSGRACDAMASYLKNKLDNKRHKLDAWNALINAAKQPQRDEYSAYMEEVSFASSSRLLPLLNVNFSFTQIAKES
jgi:hypothetical protein